MRNSPLRIGIALLTFLMGVALATSWFSRHQSGPDSGRADESQVAGVLPANDSLGDRPSFLKGKAEARRDIDEGRLRVVIAGLESLTGKIYRETLLREYGVEVWNLGCRVTDEDDEYIKGYNRASEAAIEQRHGAGVMDKAMERAEQESNRFFEELRRKYPEKK